MSLPQYPEKFADLLEFMRLSTDTNARINTLIEYADRFQEVPEHIAKRLFAPENEVPFCESEVFVWVKKQPDDTVKLYFAVNNPSGVSAKALAVILAEMLSGQPPETLARLNPEIVYDIFGPALSMGKGQGLMAMVSVVVAQAKQVVKEKAARQ